MTKSTLENLQSMKADMERRVRDMGKEGSGHQRANIHDDAAAENELNLARGTILNIGVLSGVEVILPRKEVDSIGIGNKVRLQYEDGEETIYLLGKDDVVYRTDLGTITSGESPLGKSIFGKKAGEIVEVKVNPKYSFKVKIVEIVSGDFD